jgi:hypothetical protein
MFRDNEIVRAALVELRCRESHDDERFAKREQALLGPATAALQRLALVLAPDGPLQEETLQAIQRETTVTGRMRRPTALADMLREARAGQLPALTLDDLSPLGQAADRVLRCLGAYIERDLEASSVVDDLTAIRTVCANVNNAIETRKFLDYLSIGRTMDRLIGVADAWDTALQADSIADPPHYQDGLAQDALVVIDRICDELDFRAVRRFALYRLRVFFEHFEHHRLRAELAEAESERRRREDILQRVMDRFLFQEGYFPLTSVAASRGNIDTAVVGPMEEAGIPPILVELKQVTAFQVPSQANRRAVTDAIDVGRGEVQRYRASLASRPQWGGIAPFVVVVHTCDEDISDLESDDVILIDLSATTPSRKRGRRLSRGGLTEPSRGSQPDPADS